MHPNALQSLDDAGLRRVQEWSPGSAHLPRFDRVYARSTDGSSAPGLMSGREFSKLLASNPCAHLTAVEFVRSIAGATCVVSAESIYVEIVMGHLSGLLEHAALRSRHLFARERRGVVLVEVEELEQRAYVDPESMSVIDGSNDSAATAELAAWATSIAELVSESRLPSKTLTELLITDQDFVWVDAQPYPWVVHPRAIFSANRDRVFGSAGSGKELLSTTWSPDDVVDDLTGMELALGSRPLTCHFVTYSLRRGLAVIFNH